MTGAVVIPFSSTDRDRRANLDAVRRWYAARFPDADQVVADDGGCRAGWTKAHAIARGLDRTDADVIIVADSDCLCEGVIPAVQAVASGGYRWAFPHSEIRRLGPTATDLVRQGVEPTLDMATVVRQYPAVAGGGITVITRDAWLDAPMDPRFKVTHGEDVAWGVTLGLICGRPWYPGARRVRSPLYHLYHPPILAMGLRFTRNAEVAADYRHANRRTIGDIIDRGRAHIDPPPVTPGPARGRVAVVVPVIRRPHAAEPFMRSWAATRPAASHVYAVTDAEDTATREAWQTAGATTLIGDRGSTYAAKVNYGLEATSEEHLLLLGDDVRFHDGWLDACLAAAEAGADLVSTNDLARPDLDRLAVHPMFRRSYIVEQGASLDGPGLIAHEGYRHTYVDREWSMLALDRGVYTYAPDARIEHLHPLWGKAEVDPIYELGRSSSVADARLFAQRSRTYQRRQPREAVRA